MTHYLYITDGKDRLMWNVSFCAPDDGQYLEELGGVIMRWLRSSKSTSNVGLPNNIRGGYNP